MTLKTAFIPCAGKGTRMGEIGKALPKPLWPFFEKSLLEGIYLYLQEKGLENFFVNSHHQATVMEGFIKERALPIEILFEKDLLGSGGAVHNLKKEKPFLKEVLVHNSDIFFESNKDYLNSLESMSLLCIKVKANSSYNSLNIRKDELISIEPPRSENYITFSGISKIDLQTLEYTEGRSDFFKGVFSLGQKPKCYINEEGEYWDLGTLDLYYKSCWELFLNKDSLLGKNLEKVGVIDLNKMEKNSYATKQLGVLNFSHRKLADRYPEGSIILDEQRGYVIKPQQISLAYQKFPRELAE